MGKIIYAEIVVDNRCKETDKIYHYSIPDEMSTTIQVGCRVLIPFGKGNKKVEGFVVGITHELHIDVKRIKGIVKLIDSEPVISKSLVDLAIWMKEKYLCFYIDALKATIPTSVRSKISHIVELNNIIVDVTSIQMLDIIEYIEKNDDKVDIEQLKSYFNNININSYIKKMKDKGIVNIRQVVQKDVYLKKERYLFLNDKIHVEMPNNARKQIEALKIIQSNPGIGYKDIKAKYNVEYSIINILAKKGCIHIIEREEYRDLNSMASYTSKHILTEVQKDALNKILSYCDENRPILLHGVTGSGKTEVYFEVIDKYLNLDKEAIILVPEISLTPQTIGRFKNRFGDNIAVLHSGLSQGERSDEWKKIKRGIAKIAIGARSAVFAPFNNLGIIIIDEEHENTYKSEISPKYLTREVAQKRCELENAKLILGTATPSIETYYKAQTGEFGLVEMLERVNGKLMPKVIIIDMREELKNGNKTIFSEKLINATLDTLKSGDQLILFLNRRGYSTFVSCRECGIVMKCPRCNISLTYHMNENRLTCHYCGYNIENPKNCPKCRSKNIKYFGVGTQKVEKEFQKKFNIFDTVRMDADTTTRKNSHELLLEKIRTKQSKVLIGTQMISKGLDFPDVTLVGIIAADISLNLPDFRSAEKTFQTIAQVAGRSGRGEKTGTVIVQTYSPEHYSIKYAQVHDYKGFYEEEIKARKQLDYPPFTMITNIIISGEDENAVIKKATDLSIFINNQVGGSGIETLGPVSAPIARIKNRYRWQIILKGKDEDKIKETIKKIIYNDYINENININIDMNPINML